MHLPEILIILLALYIMVRARILQCYQTKNLETGEAEGENNYEEVLCPNNTKMSCFFSRGHVLNMTRLVRGCGKNCRQGKIVEGETEVEMFCCNKDLCNGGDFDTTQKAKT